MIETKKFAGGKLNTDVEENLLNPSDWIDALNVHLGSPDMQNEAVISNPRGNRNIMTDYTLPAGINKIIGCKVDELRQRLYCFLWNSNKFHRIFYIDVSTETTEDVFKNMDWTASVDILKFIPTARINDIDIIHRDTVGDLLYWVQPNPATQNIPDPNVPPRVINVFKGQNAGGTGGYPIPIIEDYIDVAKVIPREPRGLLYVNDAGLTVNNLRRRLFQFRYRWVYDDLEKSPWGGWSNMVVPSNDLDPDISADQTKNNKIQMTLNTGPATVTKIEISVRQNIDNNWADAVLWDTLDKAELGASDNLDFQWYFTNATAGTPIDVNEAALLFSNVPLVANTQVLVNGNTLLYGNTIEGFDTPDPLQMAINVGVGPQPLPSGSSLQSWKVQGKYRFGIVYYDAQGRTDGVHTNEGCIFTTAAYLDDAGGIPVPMPASYNIFTPTIGVQLSSQPPLWAYRYRLVRSKCLSYDRFFQYVVYVSNADNEYLYLNVGYMNQSILDNGQSAIAYDYIPGDRIKFLRTLKEDFPGTVLPLPAIEAEIVAQVKDPTISGSAVTGTYLKIRRSPTLEAAVKFGQIVCEIYTPSSIPSKQLFYEFGDSWAVLNPGTANRAHDGNTPQDPTTSTPATLILGPSYGDVYIKRYVKMTAKDSFNNVPVQDMNFNEAYLSAVNDNGRGLIVDSTSGRRHYPNLVRFGGQYLQGTNINNTNIFYAGDFDEYIRDYGAIKRMRSRDKEIRIFQELKTGRVPVYQQVIQDAAGSDVIAQSDRLINKIQYFSGDYGIGNAPDSLAMNNFSDYFVDTNRHVVCRLSQDGLTPISITCFNNSLYTKLLPRYTVPSTNTFTPPNYTGDKQGDAPILGVFNALRNEYTMSFTEIASYAPGPVRTVVYSPQTRNFDERNNAFLGALSYAPEYMVNIGTKLVTFKNGIGYLHDSNTYCNFYGIQYGSYITIVFNKNPNIKKTFLSVDQYSDTVFECPIITTSNNQLSNLITSDFQDFEGHKYASFMGDSNSPGAIIDGDSLKGGWIKMQLSLATAPNPFRMITVAVKSILSNENLH